MRFVLCGLVLMPLAVGLTACKREDKAAKAEEGPLLLKEGPSSGQGAVAAASGPVADNSRCFVCHINYQEDDLASEHASANVGCEKCHGESSAHCGDENNVTAPDIMYAKDKIKAACMKCHPQLTDQHEPVLAGKTKEKYCTDCHEYDGHRLSMRNRTWDRETGVLIASDAR